MNKKVLIATAVGSLLIPWSPAMAEVPGITGLSATEAVNTLGTASGTTTYNSQAGSSSNFSLGASNQLGVNASASSTADYSVNSRAQLQSQGSFLNQSLGSSGSNLNAATQEAKTSWDSAASSAANAKYGSSWEYATGKDGGWSSEAEWQQAWDAEYTSAYSTSRESSTAKVQAAENGIITGNFDSATNSVKVTGLGSNASINTGYGSSFVSDIKAKTLDTPSNSATASGSAGANLNTNATVNSSSVEFTSTFIQSF